MSAAFAGQLDLAAGNALGGIAPESVIVLTGYIIVAATLLLA